MRKSQVKFQEKLEKFTFKQATMVAPTGFVNLIIPTKKTYPMHPARLVLNPELRKTDLHLVVPIWVRVHLK
jgi:hypothetical protein